MKTARIKLILSMIIFGTLAPFVRNVSVSSGELALYRALMAILLIGTYLVVTKQKTDFSKVKKELALLIISGAAMGINWILLFEAYKYTTVSIATLSYYFAPVIVTVLCPILFRERLGIKQVLCFVMSTLGIVLITGISTGGSSDLRGILFGLGAAMFYATVMILNKYIKNTAGLSRTIWQFAGAIVVLLPYVLLEGGINLGSVDSFGFVNLIIVGVVHTGIAYVLYFSSLKDLPGQKVAILSYIDPLVAVFISVTILGEAMTVTQIAGGALILGFTMYNELSGNRK